MTRAIQCLAVLACLWLPATAHAQTWKVPAPAERCPSKWGADDSAASGNHMKPETVLRATRLIKTGEVIEMGRVLNAAMPFFGTRGSSGPQAHVHERMGPTTAAATRSSSSARWARWGHSSTGSRTRRIGTASTTVSSSSDIATRTGFTKLGMEKVGSLMTRGVLIDVAALKGVETLPDTYEITPADLQQALQRQKLTLQPGDAVLIYTGWGKLWAKDNARYVKTCPGIGLAAAAWLAKQDPMLVGADNWPVEVGPTPTRS